MDDGADAMRPYGLLNEGRIADVADDERCRRGNGPAKSRRQVIDDRLSMTTTFSPASKSSSTM